MTKLGTMVYYYVNGASPLPCNYCFCKNLYFDFYNGLKINNYLTLNFFKIVT